MSVIERLEQGVVTGSAEEAMALGAELAEYIPKDETLALCGDLGAGKTTFVKGLARGWGIKEEVTSPSFNIFLTYKGSINLVHLDGYRITSNDDLEELMLEEFLVSPYCLVMEWPEHVKGLVPEGAWRLYFEIGPEHQYSVRLEKS